MPHSFSEKDVVSSKLHAPTPEHINDLARWLYDRLLEGVGVLGDSKKSLHFLAHHSEVLGLTVFQFTVGPDVPWALEPELTFGGLKTSALKTLKERMARKKSKPDALDEDCKRPSKIFVRNKDGKFAAHIVTLMNHHLFQRRRRPSPKSTSWSEFDPPDQSPGPLEQAIRAEADKRVRTAVKRLPKKVKTAITGQLNGLSGVEIAAQMGRKPARVSQLLKKGREILGNNPHLQSQ